MIRTEIHSRNDTFQLLMAFRENRQKRSKHNVVFVEGVAMVDAVLVSRTPVRSVVVPARRKLSDWARAVIRESAPEELLQVDDDLYAELSDKSNPTELILIVERPAHSLDALQRSNLDLIVVLDRPAGPGNLGSCIRSCNAFAAQAVVVLGHAADAWDPQALRASIGSAFTTPVVETDSPRVLTAWIDQWRAANDAVHVFGTDSAAETDIGEAHVHCPAVVMFGNEATGLSTTLREYVDTMVSIPMYGSVNSINLASAVTTVLYAVRAKRR